MPRHSLVTIRVFASGSGSTGPIPSISPSCSLWRLQTTRRHPGSRLCCVVLAEQADEDLPMFDPDCVSFQDQLLAGKINEVGPTLGPMQKQAFELGRNR